MARIHREHALEIAREISENVIEKYKLGQEEHGGYLWERDIVADMTGEIIDQVIYYATLRQQIQEVAVALEKLQDVNFTGGVEDVLYHPLFDSFRTEEEHGDPEEGDGGFDDEDIDEDFGCGR